MGMFDEKKYLTGDNGEFKAGDVFFVHAAEILASPVLVNGEPRTEVKMIVNREGQDKMTVYTSGKGIVGAVERMEPNDLPAKVELTTKQVKNGQMFQLERADR